MSSSAFSARNSGGSTSIMYDHESQTNDLMALLGSTLHSLAADAAAVRQASSLVQCVGVPMEPSDEMEPALKNPDLVQGLVNLDQVVSGLENKVTALRQILTEEKRALAKFEGDLLQEAQEQAHLVQRLMEASKALGEGTEEESDYQENHLREIEEEDVASNRRRSSLSSRGSRRDSFDPRRKSQSRRPAPNAIQGEENQNPDSISLLQITQEELDHYKAQHSVMGPRNISIIILNEALQEIEEVCQNELEVLMSRKHDPHQNNANFTSGALQRRYDYLHKRQHQQQHHPQQPGADGGDSMEVTVTEQQLRENCSFFRNGESTARTTLSVLCSLRRLKQVPTKNRQITYRCLSHSNSLHPNNTSISSTD